MNLRIQALSPDRAPDRAPDRRVRPLLRGALAAALVAATLMAGACDDAGSPTEPTTDSDGASPTVVETFSATVPVGGSRFYSFSIAEFGTVFATLRSIGGADVPPDVVVNLAIGTPSGAGCSTGAPTAVQATGDAGLTNQVVSVLPAGTHCVRVSDAGNLAGPATFTIVIEHP